MMQVDFAIITIREDEFEAMPQHIDQKLQKGSSGRTYRISQVHAKTD